MNAGLLDFKNKVVLVTGVGRESGGAFEWRFLRLFVFDPGGRVARYELFEDDREVDALARFDALVAGLWPGPLSVHRTTHGRLPREALEWPPGEGARLPRSAAGSTHAHTHGPDSTAGYAGKSFRFSPELVFSHERLARAALRASQGLAGAPLARFKGIFRTQQGFVLLEIAGGTLHEERSHHRRDSRADAIFEGADAAPAAERLAGWLEGAALTERERNARAEEIELALPDGRVCLEAHRDAYGLAPPADEALGRLIAAEDVAARIDLARAHETLAAREGIARDVTRGSAGGPCT